MMKVPARLAASPTVRGRAVLGALLLGALLFITLSTRELSDTLAAGAAATGGAVAQEQARQSGALASLDARAREDLAFANLRASDAMAAEASTEQRRAALAAELERLTPAPLPNDSRLAWPRGAVVGVQANHTGTGFAVTYQGGATYIVTALHVLGGARSAIILTPKGDYVGQLVAVSSADAALLKVDALLPILFFQSVALPGDAVSLVRYSDGAVASAIVLRVTGQVIELALPASRSDWGGFSGSPVIAAGGLAVGVMSSVDGAGSIGVAVPHAATCDLLACP